MDTTILASLARSLWRYLESVNIDAAELFQQYGLDPDLL